MWIFCCDRIQYTEYPDLNGINTGCTRLPVLYVPRSQQVAMYNIMITTVLRRTRTPRRMYSALNLASTTIIFVDTSLASLVMDGELWSRSPADLRLYRGDIGIFDPEPAKNSLNLKQSIAAHSWAQAFGGSSNLRITPRVWQELASARQVSS